ncbi:MAG: FHA domain-containing protein [Candidatus Aminicenantes bacterium]|nr:FHA domain-containing protein [Candidatus Aminicenantes bacterium]
MPVLHITCRDGKKTDVSIKENDVIMGRSVDNDIVLPDPIVSRNHAKISKAGKDYVLVDLGSHNGTRVNGKLIQRVVLQHKDEIRLGKSKLIFECDDGVPASRTATLFVTKESELDHWQQQSIRISPKENCLADSENLLLTITPAKKKAAPKMPFPLATKTKKPEIKAEASSLERVNKILFVLYEVSRQLNSSLDFDELLHKIMDLLFMVIDADFGSLILIGEEGPNDLIPVVMKSRKNRVQKEEETKISRTILLKVIQEKVALLTSDAMADSRLADAMSIVKKGIRSAMCVPLWEKDKVIGAIQLNSTRMDNLFTMDDLELLKSIGCQMAMSIAQARLNQQIREEEQLRRRLERFHSPQVIEMIVRDHQQEKDELMEAKELTTTILFTDMVKFTTLSEKMPPREINQLLNRYFSRMTDIIFEHNGTLDKYIGDGLMAVFGAPIEERDDAERAVRAALEIRRGFFALMNESGSDKRFDIRIGINTGKVVAGNIGSPRRLDYTVIGDPVNVASRLETMAEPNQVLIGEETYMQVKDKFQLREIGLTQLKGKSEKIRVYEVID